MSDDEEGKMCGQISILITGVRITKSGYSHLLKESSHDHGRMGLKFSNFLHRLSIGFLWEMKMKRKNAVTIFIHIL